MTQDSAGAGLSRLGTVFFLVCFVGILYLLYRILTPFFSVMLWAAVLTVIAYPVFRRLLKRLHGRRAAASVLTCILILLLIVLPVTLLGVMITQQSISLYQNIQDNPPSVAAVTAKLNEFQKRPAIHWILRQARLWFNISEVNLAEILRDAAGRISSFLVGRGTSLLKGVGGMVIDFFLTFITMFFLLRDGPLLMSVVRSSSPLPEVYEVEIFKKFQDVTYATFVGSLLTSAVQGGVAFLLFAALGLPAPLFWGAIVALMSLVPIVGALLVWLPWFLYLVLAGQIVSGIVLLAVGSLVISSIDNILKPLIIQGRTDMHPLLVFFSVLGGLQTFGFRGILLGPLVISMFVSFLNFYRKEYRDSLRSGIPDSGGGS